MVGVKSTECSSRTLCMGSLLLLALEEEQMVSYGLELEVPNKNKNSLVSGLQITVFSTYTCNDSSRRMLYLAKKNPSSTFNECNSHGNFVKDLLFINRIP